MELLRVFFDKRSDGVWQVEELSPITLEPVGECREFYEIKDNVFFAGPKFCGSVHSIMGQTIVPIVSHLPGETALQCLGTGFFISCSGLLMTAAHVIAEPFERRYRGLQEIDAQTWHIGDGKLGVMIPTNPLNGVSGYIFREIQWATFLAERTEHPLPFKGVDLKLRADTALCQVEPIAVDVPYQPLPIVQPGIKGVGMGVGKTATAIGYAGMKAVELTQEDEKVVSGDFAFSLHVSRGKILKHFPDNMESREVPAPGACFSSSILMPPGMSGSPIFDDERVYVHGVVSKGWEDENGPEHYGYGSMLAPSLHLPIRFMEGKSLLEIQASGKYGMPGLSAPDM